MLSVYVAYAIFAFVSPLSIVPISNGNIKANREYFLVYSLNFIGKYL